MLRAASGSRLHMNQEATENASTGKISHNGSVNFKNLLDEFSPLTLISGL
jgi:hypothetical protein